MALYCFDFIFVCVFRAWDNVSIVAQFRVRIGLTSGTLGETFRKEQLLALPVNAKMMSVECLVHCWQAI